MSSYWRSCYFWLPRWGIASLSASDLLRILRASILCAGLGWGMLSFSTFALGLAGALHPVVFWGALLLGLLLLRADVREVLTGLHSLRFPFGSRFERVLAYFVAATLILAFIRALTPPLAWDSQLYHLAVGKYWIAQGRITAPPDIALFSYPAFVENLYLGALLLKGDTLAQTVHWSFLLLTLGLVFLLSERFFSSRVGWISTAMLAAAPSFVLIGSWAYVDVALAFYATAALYCVLRATEGRAAEGRAADGRATGWRATARVAPTEASLVAASASGDTALELGGSRRAGWYIIAGLFAGLALGIKYTALIVPIALLVLILIRGVNQAFVRRALLFLVPALALAAPWYLRNWIFQGNPVYPFLFGGPFWDSFRAEQFSRLGSGLLQEPLRLAIAPWEATITGQEGGLGYEATIGPLFLVFLPALFLTRRNGISSIPPLLIFSGILYAFWLFGVGVSKLLWQTRFLFPAFPALAIAAGVALDSVSRIGLGQVLARAFLAARYRDNSRLDAYGASARPCRP